MLRETEAIEWIECADVLEASVREARLIRELDPRFNRQPREAEAGGPGPVPGRWPLRADVAPRDAAGLRGAGSSVR